METRAGPHGHISNSKLFVNYQGSPDTCPHPTSVFGSDRQIRTRTRVNWKNSDPDMDSDTSRLQISDTALDTLFRRTLVYGKVAIVGILLCSKTWLVSEMAILFLEYDCTGTWLDIFSLCSICGSESLHSNKLNLTVGMISQKPFPHFHVWTVNDLFYRGPVG